jgi:Large ribosomal RNA subunit accumulation protein YceD
MTSTEPFSRALRVDALPKEGQTLTIEATAAERKALAALYNVPAIEALTASLSVRRTGRHDVNVKGSVHGELTQVCVVSLEPFPATVDEDIEVRFARRSGDGAARRPFEEPETFSMADEDEPDPIIDGKIDLGVLAAEFFALGLDPYPRKPGVSFDPPADQGDALSPFSALGGKARKEPN